MPEAFGADRFDEAFWSAALRDRSLEAFRDAGFDGFFDGPAESRDARAARDRGPPPPARASSSMRFRVAAQLQIAHDVRS